VGDGWGAGPAGAGWFDGDATGVGELGPARRRVELVPPAAAALAVPAGVGSEFVPVVGDVLALAGRLAGDGWEPPYSVWFRRGDVLVGEEVFSGPRAGLVGRFAPPDVAVGFVAVRGPAGVAGEGGGVVQLVYGTDRSGASALASYPPRHDDCWVPPAKAGAGPGGGAVGVEVFATPTGLVWDELRTWLGVLPRLGPVASPAVSWGRWLLCQFATDDSVAAASDPSGAVAETVADLVEAVAAYVAGAELPGDLSVLSASAPEPSATWADVRAECLRDADPSLRGWVGWVDELTLAAGLFPAVDVAALSRLVRALPDGQRERAVAGLAVLGAVPDLPPT
jgi:hypothetical protein